MNHPSTSSASSMSSPQQARQRPLRLRAASSGHAIQPTLNPIEVLAQKGIRRTQDLSVNEAWGLYGFRNGGNGPASEPATPTIATATQMGEPRTPDGFGGYLLTPELFGSPQPSAAQRPPAPRILPGPASTLAAARTSAQRPRNSYPPHPSYVSSPPLPGALNRMASGPLRLPTSLNANHNAFADNRRIVSAASYTTRVEEYDPQAGKSPTLIEAQRERVKHWRWSAPITKRDEPMPGKGLFAGAAAFQEQQQQVAMPVGLKYRRSAPSSPLRKSFGPESLLDERGPSPPQQAALQHAQSFVRRYPAASANIVLRPGMIAPPCISRGNSNDSSGNGDHLNNVPASPISKFTAALKHATSLSRTSNASSSRDAKPPSKPSKSFLARKQLSKDGSGIPQRPQPQRQSSLFDRIKSSGQKKFSAKRADALGTIDPFPVPQRARSFDESISNSRFVQGQAFPRWPLPDGHRRDGVQMRGTRSNRSARSLESMRGRNSAYELRSAPFETPAAGMHISQSRSSGGSHNDRKSRRGSRSTEGSALTRSSKQSLSAESRSSSQLTRSYGGRARGAPITAAQELSKALGSASQSSDSAYAICERFKSQSAETSCDASRRSSRSSRSNRSSIQGKLHPNARSADALRTAALQVPPRPAPTAPSLVMPGPGGPALRTVAQQRYQQRAQAQSQTPAQRPPVPIFTRSAARPQPLATQLARPSARNAASAPAAASPPRSLRAPSVQTQAPASSAAVDSAARSSSPPRGPMRLRPSATSNTKTAPRSAAPSIQRPLRRTGTVTSTVISEDDANARTDDEAGQLWKSLEKRLGVDLDSQIPVKRGQKPAEKKSEVAKMKAESQTTSNTPEQVSPNAAPRAQSRIPVASYRLRQTKITAVESKPKANMAPASAKSSRVPLPLKLGPGQCEPLPRGSARRNAISVDPSFRRVLSATSKLPMSSSMKDPTLSIISEGACETPRHDSDRAEVTDANVGILDSTLRSLLVCRQASDSGSEYSQDSALGDSEDSDSSDEEALATPPAAQRGLGQPSSKHALDANLLREKLSKVLAKQARQHSTAKTGSLDTRASLADMTAILRTDSPDVTLETSAFDADSSYIGFASQARRSAASYM